MRVIVSAYACNPTMASEQGVGWTWVRAAASRHEVVVLTRSKHRPAIDEAIRQDPSLDLTPIYIEWPTIRRILKRFRAMRIYYIFWQFGARKHVAALAAEAPFDVQHHLTFAADWLPIAFSREDETLIWGPVGGATRTPKDVKKWLGWRGRLFEIARTAASSVGRLVFARGIAARAALIVAQNHDTAERFRASGKLVIEPNAAVRSRPEESGSGSNKPPTPQLKTAVFVGRLIPWKGVAIAIDAIARPEASEWLLELYGEGPDEGRLKRLAESLGISDRIVFHGFRPQNEIHDAFATADAMLFPTMHDSGPGSVAEALSAGCPVVCLAHGGPDVIVGPDQGIKVVPVGDVAGHLARALSQLRGRIEPDDRWSADRLPDLLDGWYQSVVEQSIRS